MKKLYPFLILCIILFSFCGCSSDEPATSQDIETQYYNYAQQCVNEGNVDQAVKVLEEGIKNTGNEKLKEFLNSLTSGKLDATTDSAGTTTTATQKSAKSDFEKYAGSWYCADSSLVNSSWVNELVMDIAIKDDKLAIVLQYSCDFLQYPGEYYEIAKIKKVVSLSDVKNGILLLEYDDDGYGNSGMFELTFLEDRIFCVSTVNEQENEYGEIYSSDWSFGFGTRKFVKKETVEDLFE